MAGLADDLMAGPPPVAGPKPPMPGAPAALEPEAPLDELDIPAQDLIDAVGAGDKEGVKAALRAAMAVIDTEALSEE